MPDKRSAGRLGSSRWPTPSVSTVGSRQGIPPAPPPTSGGVESQLHEPPNPDVAAHRSQRRTAQQQVTSQARNEAGVVGERDERAVVAELLHCRRVRDDEKRKRDGGRDEPGQQ